MNILAVGLLDTAIHTFWLIGSVLLPLVLFAWIVHRLERFVQIRLAERFGWNSVLWTAWLGTPIHELSHAFFCVVFRHRIDEIQLFEPDLKSGRLGYVKHSFRKKNWFEQIGNVFIGVAPLVGGSIALSALLLMFYSDVAMEGVELLRERSEDQSSWSAVTDAVWLILSGLCHWSHLVTVRFWVFVYLVLCVGNHMAPSKSDYEGARQGALLFAVLVWGLVFVLSLVTGNSEQLLPWFIEVLAPFFALLILAVILCVLGAILVFSFTALFKPRYVIKTG